MTPRQQHISDLNALTIKYGSIFLSIIKKDYIRTAKAIIEAKDVNVQIVVDERRYAYNLYKLYLTIGIDKALEEHNKLARSLKASNDLMIYDWLTFLKGYADKTLAERVTKIPDTTRDKLRELIQKGLEGGKGYEDIAKTIQKEGDGDFSKYRSLLIARTEGNNAVNAGAYIAARASGLQMVKRWLHAGHAKRENRSEHVRLSKLEPIGLNDYFNVNGKQMLFPGDPAGGAGENCNCRCVCSYRPQRGADGLVIAVNRRAYEVTGIQRAERTALVDRILAEYEDVVVARNVVRVVPVTPVKPVIHTLETEIKEVMELAKEAGPEVEALGKEIAEKYNGTLTPINYKSAESIRRKVLAYLGGDVSQLKDAVRNTVVVPFKDLNKVVKDLEADKETFIRVKVQEGAEYFGYKGVITNIKTETGIVAEMQVNSPGMIYAKVSRESALQVMDEKTYNKIASETGLEGGLGHHFYEEIRVLMAKVNSGTATDEEIDKVGELIKESIKYYSKFYGY